MLGPFPCLENLEILNIEFRSSRINPSLLAYLDRVGNIRYNVGIETKFIAPNHKIVNFR